MLTAAPCYLWRYMLWMFPRWFVPGGSQSLCLRNAFAWSTRLTTPTLRRRRRLHTDMRWWRPPLRVVDPQ
jgi:hypothetical protein